MWFLPCFFCMSPTWGQLRCSKVTLGLANSAPGPRCLQMAVEIREFPLTGHPSSPSQSDSRWSMLPFQMNTGWKRHRQTEATLSPCAKCAGKAGAKPGCVNGSASPLILALGQGSLLPHPQAPHGPAIWEELVLLQQLLEAAHPAGNVLLQPLGIRSAGQGCAGPQDPSEEPCRIVPPPLSARAAGQSGSCWLGGGSQWTWATSSSNQG